MGIIQPPSIAPTVSSGVERDDHWRSYDNSVNAVSFGFVATAILISMFLIMAIFERFLRQRPSGASGRSGSDLEAQSRIHGKLEYPSPKVCLGYMGPLFCQKHVVLISQKKFD